MEKLNRAVVIALNEKSMNELTSGAAGIAGEVILICPHTVESPSNAAKAYRLCGGESAVQLIPTIVKLCKELAPDVILLDCSKNSRLIAAHAAAEFETAAQVDVSELRVEGGARDNKAHGVRRRCIQRGALRGNGGRLRRRWHIFRVGQPRARSRGGDIRRATGGVTLCRKARKRRPPAATSALPKLVVGVGRGASEESDLELCKAFAAKLGAELGLHPSRGRGETVAAQGALHRRFRRNAKAQETYIAVGISGQIQHVVGISSAGTIIAVDKNEAAPIFKYCDYGIAGDLRKIIPALTALIG